MTLVACWIRETPGSKEMLVASDSRLTGGFTLDQSAKIMRLARNDCVLAFCGTTRIAYPIMIQLQNSFDAYEPIRTRVKDICDLKTHVEKFINNIRTSISDLPQEKERNDFKILLAGYSWKLGRFLAWTFKINLQTGYFNAFEISGHRKRTNGRKYFIFMSDVAENEKSAAKFVYEKMHHDGTTYSGGLDWEPFDALLNAIGNEKVKDIGGAPQLVKIYKHSNTLPINVIWGYENKNGQAIEYVSTSFGRKPLGYERNDYLSLDPFSKQLIEPWNVRDYIEKLNFAARQEYELNLRQTVLRNLLYAIQGTLLRRECSIIIEALRNSTDKEEVPELLVALNSKGKILSGSIARSCARLAGPPDQ